MSRVLITGGAGYIGSVLVPYLLSRPWCTEVHVLDNLMYCRDTLNGSFGNPGFRLFVGDVRNSVYVRKAMCGTDVVVHLAGLVGDARCDRDHTDAHDVNIRATEIIVNEAARVGVGQLIFASTCSNYGTGSGDELANEESELNPVSTYAKTKVAAERIVLDAGGLVLRFATAYGVSPRTRFDTMLNAFVKSAYIRNEVKLYNAEAWRPFVHVRDIARMIALCITNEVRGEVINVGGHNRRKVDLAHYIRKLFKDVQIVIAAGITDKRDYCVDFNKAEYLVGFKPKHDPEVGMREIRAALDLNVFDFANRRYGND